MKTKLVAVIALIFCAFMAEASKVEGNGNIITKEISVDNYSEIELGGNIEYSGNNFWGNRSNKKFPVFKYTHGRSASLKITIDENLFPLLSIKSNNGRLAIRIQDGTRIKPTQLKSCDAYPVSRSSTTNSSWREVSRSVIIMCGSMMRPFRARKPIRGPSPSI